MLLFVVLGKCVYQITAAGHGVPYELVNERPSRSKIALEIALVDRLLPVPCIATRATRSGRLLRMTPRFGAAECRCFGSLSPSGYPSNSSLVVSDRSFRAVSRSARSSPPRVFWFRLEACIISGYMFYTLESRAILVETQDLIWFHDGGGREVVDVLMLRLTVCGWVARTNALVEV